MEESGALIRLYPVPFRLIGDGKQFRKWQWITAHVEKARRDHRPESHKISVDTIICDPRPVPTNNDWRVRRASIENLSVFRSFEELDAERKRNGKTLGLLRPSRILELEISPADKPDWTDSERKKLLQLQEQGDLFDEADARSLATLKKLPFDFHYRYVCEISGTEREYRHKIADWEAGALYWNVRRSHGAKWEGAFRAKLEEELPARDLMFLMGTIHRFPEQWLIASLIYPPKPRSAPSRQQPLFLR